VHSSGSGMEEFASLHELKGNWNQSPAAEPETMHTLVPWFPCASVHRDRAPRSSIRPGSFATSPPEHPTWKDILNWHPMRGVCLTRASLRPWQIHAPACSLEIVSLTSLLWGRAVESTGLGVTWILVAEQPQQGISSLWAPISSSIKCGWPHYLVLRVVLSIHGWYVKQS
jgi:hypothetical protein